MRLKRTLIFIDIYQKILLSIIQIYNKNKLYPVSFRVIRFKLFDGYYETLITNLDQSAFQLWKMKALYNMRRDVETSFRELKYTIELTCFHAKKMDYIYQVSFTTTVRVCNRFFRRLADMASLPIETLVLKFTLPVRFE